MRRLSKSFLRTGCMAHAGSVYSGDAERNAREPGGAHRAQAPRKSRETRIPDRNTADLFRSLPWVFGENEQRCSSHGNLQTLLHNNALSFVFHISVHILYLRMFEQY